MLCPQKGSTGSERGSGWPYETLPGHGDPLIKPSLQLQALVPDTHTGEEGGQGRQRFCIGGKLGATYPLGRGQVGKLWDNGQMWSPAQL